MSTDEIALMADRFLYCLRLKDRWQGWRWSIDLRLICRDRRVHKVHLLDASRYDGGAIHFERN